jgi:site-specific DNA recombinase
MITAIYIRISKEDTGRGERKKSMSPEMQLEKCRQYCEMSELENIRIYQDLDISGTKDSRPAFDTMLKDIDNRLIGDVVVYSMSRLSRSLRTFLNIVTVFDKKKVVFHAIKERIDLSTPQGRMIANIWATMNQFEAEQTAERTSDNLQLRKNNLKVYGKNQPYGFKKEEGSLLPDDYEIKIVQAAFSWKKQGKGERATATQINKEYTPRKGKKFYPASIVNIWGNEKFYKANGVI